MDTNGNGINKKEKVHRLSKAKASRVHSSEWKWGTLERDEDIVKSV